MNRTEAEALIAELRADRHPDYSEHYGPLPPWQRPPATCNRCPGPVACRILFDGEFLCGDHADTRMNELADLYGSAGSIGPRTSWGMWLRSFYWRPYYWLTLKQGPFRPFMIRRAWYRWIFGRSGV